jgi:hypothetical protein
MAVNKDTTRTENINKIGENNTFEVTPTDIQEVNSTMINDMVVDGRSLGSETDVFKGRDDGADNDGILEFRSLKAGTNITLSLDGEAILITGADAPDQTQNLQEVFDKGSTADSSTDIEMSRSGHKIAITSSQGIELSTSSPSGVMSWKVNPSGIQTNSSGVSGGSTMNISHASFEYVGSATGGASVSKKATVADGEELSTDDGSGSTVTAKTSSSTFKANGVANDEFYDFEVKPLNMKLVSGGNSISALGVSLYGNATTQRFKIGKDNAPVDDATATLDIDGDLRVREVPTVTDNSLKTLVRSVDGKIQERNDEPRFMNTVVIVTQDNVATTLGGVIDSTKEYLIDGIINMGSIQITVPTTGITLKGFSFNISGLTSSEDNYTMFVSESPVIGSGDVLGADYYITVSGTNSKVYELYDATGFNAFEFQRVNYNNCTSLGDLYDYRQGLELGTGRFYGSPSLTLHGTWLGGYRITTSIVRLMSDTTAEPLFKAGTAFVMNSRFLTDINVDLGTLQPFCDFAPSNLPNSSTLQVHGAIFTRDGLSTSSDTNVFSNILSSDLSSDFIGNNGITNTYVGGNASVITEVETTINTQGVYETLGGVWLPLDLQHFDSPSNGQLRHIGKDPREYEISANIVLEGTQSDSVTIKFRKWDDSTSSFSELDYTAQTRVVNNLQGGRDVAYFSMLIGTTLDQNDYIYLQVKNNDGTGNVTAELGSFFRVSKR